MRKKLFFTVWFSCLSICLFAQQYKQWDNHDVIRFYEKKEITLDSNSLDEEGNDIYNRTITYFVPTKVKDGVYEIEVSEKISSKLWQIKGTNIYMYFRYNPYLYKFDEGILNVSYSSGIFYKKP
jgi:hypothetical protein